MQDGIKGGASHLLEPNQSCIAKEDKKNAAGNKNRESRPIGRLSLFMV